MITRDFTGTDVLATGHTCPAGVSVGASDDSPSVSVDFPSPATGSSHRWRVNLPSLAGKLVHAGKDWRAYPQNPAEVGDPRGQLAGRRRLREGVCGDAQPIPLRRPGRAAQFGFEI